MNQRVFFVQFIVSYVHLLYNKAKEMIFMAAATTNIRRGQMRFSENSA